MTIYHKNLGQSWQKMSFSQQMANVGSEVYRAIAWQEKNNSHYSMLSFERALELLDYTTDTIKDFYRLRELKRLREVLVDFFAGENIYKSSSMSLNNYFYSFNYVAAIARQKAITS